MPPKDKYTDPELRDEIKEELKQSDKGGAPGQWSARKAVSAFKQNYVLKTRLTVPIANDGLRIQKARRRL